ncbi:MAG: LytTR family DNA-binding domain-containing protein, partial [Lachnospiraceae bacterium]|nr:LytTR family DNA-binding domain-containing protein [Lachnospiraceae bacterium]
MHYHAALVDDEPLYQQIVSSRITAGLQALGCSCVVSVFGCDDDLLDAMKNQSFDMFFLDIAVWGYNGIHLAQKLRKMGIVAPITFVSAMEDQVFEAFRVQPLGFIRKSAMDRDFPPLLERLVVQLENMESQKIQISAKEGQLLLRTGDILYVESSNKVQLVHIANKVLEARHNMSYFESKLPKDVSIRS